MPWTTLRPDSDDKADWTEVGGVTAWEVTDDDPDTSNRADYIESAAANLCRVNVQTFTLPVGEVVRRYEFRIDQTPGTGAVGTYDLLVENGASPTAQIAGGGDGVRSASAVGSLTQAQIDTLKLQVNQTGAPSTPSRVYAWEANLLHGKTVDAAPSALSAQSSATGKGTTKIKAKAAALGAASALSGAGRLNARGQAALSASSELTAEPAALLVGGGAALSALAELIGAGDLKVPGFVDASPASLSAEGLASVEAVVLVAAAPASLDGFSDVEGSGGAYRSGGSFLSASSALGGAGNVLVMGRATLAVASDLNGSGGVILTGEPAALSAFAEAIGSGVIVSPGRWWFDLAVLNDSELTLVELNPSTLDLEVID